MDRETATQEWVKEAREHSSFMKQCQPRHAAKCKQFEREWFKACDDAFCEAMIKAGYRRIVKGSG